MRSRNIQQIFIFITALFVVILSSGAVSGQGKGHNKGGDKQGSEMRGGGQQQRHERTQPQREEQRISPVWQKQEQRQQEGRVEQQGRPDVRQIPNDRGFEQWRNPGDRDARKQKHYDGNQPGWQHQVPLSNAWPRNYGQWRSNEVRIRNAERKAWKNEEKALRSNVRNNGSYVYRNEPYYWDNRSPYQYPQHARASVLRNLIASVLGSNTRYSNNNYSQAQPVYYGSSYNPVNYSTGYYNTYPQYQSYAVAPTYYSYQPYGYTHAPQYTDPYYSGNGDNRMFSNYSDSGFGGGFVQQIFGNLLAQGYDQGYVQGLNARRAGYGDRYYYDPYDYGDNGYVSYSNTLSENRRCLSDGYELGYNDALYNQRAMSGSQDYDPYQNTNADLVSVLIGSVLQGFNS